MANVMDELLYFAVGVAAGKLTKVAAKKYADPKVSMNFASLKHVGKPSVYIPGGLGIAATGYVVYQGDKFGRLKDEEYALAGFGVFSLIDTVSDLLVSATTTPPATSTGIRIISPGVPVRPGMGMVPTGMTLRGVV